MQTLGRCLSCVIVVVCIVSVSEQQSIELTHLPDPLFFLSSQAIQLTCSYNPSQHTFQHWLHPSGTQISSSSGRFTVRSQSRSTILTVRQTEENDRGTYSCVFRNSQGGSESRSIVGHFRQAVTIAAPPPEYNVTIGNSATLSCEARHQNRVQWQNSNRNAISSSSDGRVQIQGTNLYFREVRLGDNGIYYCLASNEISNDEITSHLVVLETPSVNVTPPSTTVNLNESVTLMCEAQGSPRPSIIWTKLTDTLEVDTRYINKIEENVSPYMIRTQLIFHSIRNRDIGTYHCAASNRAGSASGTTTIQLIGTPSGPRMVELSLVNSTGVNVSWLPPEKDGNVEIISYTVTWMVANSTSSGGGSHTLRGPNPTYHLVSDLHWLTTYTVLVYASNRIGRGSDSEEMNITTDATVPAAPDEVTFMDLAPTSVQVTWRLSANDGGAPITSVRVYYRAMNQTWREARFKETFSLDSSSLLIRGLRDNTQYQLQMVAGNRMGFGPPRDSESFHTPPPGFPASPTHITATNITDTTAIICWVASDLGRPFRSFNIHAIVNSTSQGILKTVPASKVLRHIPNCTEGAQITDLEPATCYTFTVAIRNDQGLGQPGAELDVYCTLSLQPCVNDDCTPCPSDNCSPGETAASIPRATGLSSEIIAILVVCALIGVALLILVVFLLWKISSTLKRQKSYEFSDVPPPSDPLQRESSRSDKTLLEHDQNRNGQQQFLTQPSISSQNSSSDQDTPNTAITVISENSPFTFTPPVSAHTLEYPRSASLGSMGRSFQMYPIPEHSPVTHPYIPPNAHQHTHTLPNHWQIHPYPTSDTRQQNSQEEFEMIENPSNQRFEQEKQAELQSQMLNFSHEVEDPEDEIPPPIPPYRGEDITNHPSPHLPPPYLGESVSQPANSPRLQHSNCEFHIPDSEEEEDLEFIDNDAYEKVTPSPQSLRRAPPRFAIKSNQRGAVFETVDLRH